MTVADHFNPMDHMTVTDATQAVLYVPADADDVGHIDVSGYFTPAVIGSDPTSEYIIVTGNQDYNYENPIISGTYQTLQQQDLLTDVPLAIDGGTHWFLDHRLLRREPQQRLRHRRGPPAGLRQRRHAYKPNDC